jgi:uncharacterized repeat protein (TIGR03803 family)
MRSKRFSVGLMTAIVAVLVTAHSYASAQQVQIIHNFNGNKGGENSEFTLVRDSAGNIYGTTQGGGFCEEPHCWVVFELTPTAVGDPWTEKVLHAFNSANKRGSFPSGPVILDASGNVYGETELGGPYIYGTVFRLTRQANGSWTETILHNFGNGIDGSEPIGGLTLDADGNLYGTTSSGGKYGSGTVFELVPNADGSFSEKLLHSFKSDGSEGQFPQAGVIFDSMGNIYGTTAGNLASRSQTVFELTPRPVGGWLAHVLHRFCNTCKNNDGPSGGLTLDAAGNLYGTTFGGGIHRAGMVFELSPVAGGGWTNRTLYNFCSEGCVEGGFPAGSLVFDAAGNLYGTTAGGDGGNGTVFELSPTTTGTCNEKVLSTFCAAPCGDTRVFGVMMNPSGNLYGSIWDGGKNGDGAIFEITP